MTATQCGAPVVGARLLERNLPVKRLMFAPHPGFVHLTGIFVGLTSHRGGTEHGVLGWKRLAAVADCRRVCPVHVLAVCLGILLAQARV